MQCSGGYQSNEDGTRCVDIDECETGEATCGPDQLCKNKEGGYICSCPPGYILNAARYCEDMNECELSGNTVCSMNAKCVNTVGSYRCDCNEGFRKQNDDDKVCIDVDECKDVQGLCQQRCINYFGSYRCACDAGFKLSENNRTCEDIDECEIHKSFNLCVGICQNTPGSYQCRCPHGYRLSTDGRICHDINECEEQEVCRGSNEVCTNIRGSYRCNRITCPPDYMIDPNKKNRCRRISMSCNQGDLECLQKPSAYSHNFITLAADMTVPPSGRALFNLKGQGYYQHTEFTLRLVDARAPGGVVKAREDYFMLHKMHNEGVINLMRSLQGPQELELELSMTAFHNNMPSGRSVAKIFIIVSEYTY